MHFMTKRAPWVGGILFFLVFPFVYLQPTNNSSGVIREAMLNKSDIFIKTHDWRVLAPRNDILFCTLFIFLTLSIRCMKYLIQKQRFSVWVYLVFDNFMEIYVSQDKLKEQALTTRDSLTMQIT